MFFRPDRLWTGTVTTQHFGAAATALWVTEARSSAAALAAVRDTLTGAGIGATLALRGVYSAFPAEEAARMAVGLAAGAVRIGGFGYDEAREIAQMAPFAPDQRLRQTSLGASDPEQIAAHLFDEDPAPGDFRIRQHAYAVLDGARIFGLPEKLEASGLDHACLFGGDALKDFGHVAPWVVRLLPDHALTTAILERRETGAPAREPAGALLLKSPLSLRGLRGQLRRFTMLQDEQRNRRVHFRFYDPLVFLTMITNISDEVQSDFSRGITRFLCDRNGETALVQR